MKKSLDEESLEYHAAYPAGKTETGLTKPCNSSKDLSLAYSPGVAAPCMEISRDPDLASKYTGKQNLVGVVSNGTAVLGLGNIGPLASKPVMEGKAVLFKLFGDVNAFDIEINETDPDKFIDIVASLEPTFGGINLEDIKAPECFYIEEELKKRMSIPVFHDDQHGTAIVALAALINSCIIQGKEIDKIKIVFSGAGSSAIATAKMMLSYGVPVENIIMCDSRGPITTDREVNSHKAMFASETNAETLGEALVGADCFVGMSVADLVTKEMIISMASKPIVFALANPNPEISYDLAMSAREDMVFATGRSDYPNQVNNVLGFPYIFKGALAVRASEINDEMKLAASKALADLAREVVPPEVDRIYREEIGFGPEYIIPKPLDKRAKVWVSYAVAKAAIETGVGERTEAFDQMENDFFYGN